MNSLFEALIEPLDDWQLAHLKLEQLRQKGIINAMPGTHVKHLQDCKDAAIERIFEIVQQQQSENQ